MNQRAITVLEEERQKIKDDAAREVADLDHLIAQLKEKRMESTDKRSIAKVRPGQYSGMKMAAALQAYLNERDGEMGVERAAIDLALGGLGMGSRPERNLKICISNNARLFEYDKEADRVRLLKSPKAHGPAKHVRGSS